MPPWWPRVCRDVDLVVCCGGDGTFNETLAGILEAGLNTPSATFPPAPPTILPPALKLSSDILEATQDIILGSPVAYDSRQIWGAVLLYVASFGAFTRTSYATPQGIKNTLGHTAYVWRAFRSCPRCARSISR